MPTFKKGATTPSTLYVGSQAVQKIYKGSTQVWPETVATPAENQVIFFGSTQTGLHRDVSQMLTFLRNGIGTNHIWFGFFTYYDGTTSGGRSWSLTRGNADNITKIYGSFDSVGLGSSPGFVSQGASGPGWYWVVQEFWGDGNNVYCRMYQNGKTPVTGSVGVGISGASYLSSLTRQALGYVPDSNPDGFSVYRNCGFCWGTGNPSNLHSWVYNAGDFRNPSAYNFAGDTSITLFDQIETAARVDDGLGNDVVPASDLVEGSVWTEVGSVQWSTLGPPWVGGQLALFDGASIPASAPNTLVVTFDPASVAWSNPTVDLGQVFIYSARGFGKITADSYTVDTSAGAVTVTFTLNRSVYASEPVYIDLSSGWLSDARGNSGDVIAGQVVANNATLSNPSTSNGISMGRISFSFAAQHQIGFDANGRGWVRDTGSGVTVTERYPVTQKLGTFTIHGTEKNPYKDRDKNGLDSRTWVGEDHSSLIVTFPVSLAAKDSLVGAYSNINSRSEYGGTTRHPVYVREYQGLYVTDNIALAPSDYVPPLVGFTAANRPAPTTGINVAAIASSLPSYSTSGHDKPDYEVVIRRLERYNPCYAKFNGVETRRIMTPSGFTNLDGYGLNVCQTMSAAQLILLAADATASQKQRVVSALIGHFIQWDSSTVFMAADGGQNQGIWSALVLGDYWVKGGTGIASILSNYGSMNEGGQAFQITDNAMLSRITNQHSSTSAQYPKYNNSYTIDSVSGSSVVFPASMMSSTTATNLRNLKLHRISDGQEVVVTGYNTDTAYNTIYVSGTTTPALQAGDVVTFKAPWTQQVGEYDWRVKGAYGDGELAVYSPSSLAAYRNLNTWSGEVMVIKALGLMHANFSHIEGYVVRANAPSNPTTSNDFASHHPAFYVNAEEAKLSSANGRAATPDENFTWAADFWNSHWNTIKNVTQKV